MTQREYSASMGAKWRRWALSVGLLLTVLPLLGSCLAAPFLIPFLQLGLLVYVIPAAIIGLIGGWRRSWRFTLVLTFGALLGLVMLDIMANPYGYTAIFEICVYRRQPPGYEYYHSWSNLVQVVVLVLGPGVAIAAHAVVERVRDSAKTRQVQAALCHRCGYSLRGLSESRCPECGEGFDAKRVEAAIRAIEEMGTAKAGD